MRFGQTSSSTSAIRFGLILFKNRLIEKLKSKGKRVTWHDWENNSCALANPVSVVTHTTTSYPLSWRSCTRVRIALTSPTDTAWRSTLFDDGCKDTPTPSRERMPLRRGCPFRREMNAKANKKGNATKYAISISTNTDVVYLEGPIMHFFQIYGEHSLHFYECSSGHLAICV